MTNLDGYRLANQTERRQHHAQVVFFRSASDGRQYKIYGARCHESWEQWGAPPNILSDNVSTIENWLNGLIEA